MKGPQPILAFPTRLLTGRLLNWVTTFMTHAAAKLFFQSKFKIKVKKNVHLSFLSQESFALTLTFQRPRR